MSENQPRVPPFPKTPGVTVNPRISSLALFQSGQVIEIDHQGIIYRLQITRQGKLILTK